MLFFFIYELYLEFMIDFLSLNFIYTTSFHVIIKIAQWQ